MKASIKKLWIAALRSGGYKQIAGGLRLGDRFCCLGVLCDLAVQDGLPVVVNELKNGDETQFYYDDQPGMLPKSVMNWSGVEMPLGTLPVNAAYRSLAQANDHGEPFKQIANYIERYF